MFGLTIKMMPAIASKFCSPSALSGDTLARPQVRQAASRVIGPLVPNPGAPVSPLVPPANKAWFRILLYTGPYTKVFYVPATSIGRSARLFLVIQKESVFYFTFLM